LNASKSKVYLTRLIPRPGIEILEAGCRLEINEADGQLGHEDLCAKAAAFDGLLTLLTDPIDRAVLEAGQTLRVVANVAVGFDNIDVGSATELGIVVTNTPGVLTETTADFAWALLMAIARRVVEGDGYLRAGRYHGWGIQLLLGSDIYGATLGIVGMGRIGQAVARRASGFNMRVVYFDEYRLSAEQEAELGVTYADRDLIFSQSDFVSIHTPLTPETRHLISWDRIQTMKPTACLVNTSRGPVVNEAELARALREGKLAGAALDVFEQEPAVHPDLLNAPNVILTPHIASASVATRTRMATMAAENCLAALNGQTPPNIVNPDVLQTDAFQRRRSTAGAA
jgi:glyoxylate reductase